MYPTSIHITAVVVRWTTSTNREQKGVATNWLATKKPKGTRPAGLLHYFEACCEDFFKPKVIVTYMPRIGQVTVLTRRQAACCHFCGRKQGVIPYYMKFSRHFNFTNLKWPYFETFVKRYLECFPPSSLIKT